MIAYRDFELPDWGFIPRKNRERENLDRAIVEVNEWVVRESIELINVETTGLSDRALIRAVRVWHRARGAKTASIPEV